MPTYTITELAREFDITPRAIRFYEDQGLISPKREGAGGRTRVYTARERTRLKLTLRGKRLGLTLSEIKSLVDMYESPKDSTAQLRRFLVVLASHRETLEQQREDIEVTLAEIAAHEDECKRLLAAGGIRAKAADDEEDDAARAAKPSRAGAGRTAGANGSAPRPAGKAAGGAAPKVSAKSAKSAMASSVPKAGKTGARGKQAA